MQTNLLEGSLSSLGRILISNLDAHKDVGFVI